MPSGCAALRRRRAVQACVEDHRSHRIGRGRTCAAGVQQMAGRADSDCHDDSGGDGADRAASDGRGAQPRRGGRCARIGGPGDSRRARADRLQRRRAAARSGRSAICCERNSLTLAVAESCSGGLLASRITDVPGSSDYFDRGAVCYSNRAKEEWLGVPGELIDGARRRQRAGGQRDGRWHCATGRGSDVGIGITGIAGPGGGTPEKPVGTVAIAVTTPSAQAGADLSVPRRPRHGEVPVRAGGDEHAAADVAGCLELVCRARNRSDGAGSRSRRAARPARDVRGSSLALGETDQCTSRWSSSAKCPTSVPRAVDRCRCATRCRMPPFRFELRRAWAPSRHAGRAASALDRRRRLAPSRSSASRH